MGLICFLLLAEAPEAKPEVVVVAGMSQRFPWFQFPKQRITPLSLAPVEQDKPEMVKQEAVHPLLAIT